MDRRFYVVTPPETPQLAGGLRGDNTDEPPRGLVREHGGPTLGPTFGGLADIPPGGLADIPPGGTDVDIDVPLVSSNVDNAFQELDRELDTLRNRLHTLSMKRTQRVTADVHQAPSDRSSPVSDTVIFASQRNVTNQPPRTATVREGRSSKNEIPATKHQVQASEHVVLPSVSNVAGEGIRLGKSGVFKTLAPKTSAGTGNDQVNTAADAAPNTAKKAGRKPLKLERFDGVQTPLETYLAKFDNCQRYNEWSSDECAVFLRDSLTGIASQVLWEVSPDAGHEEIIKLLRNRFGNSHQMERYRAELNARRRKRGESAQSVYQDIKRLMALGFPGQFGEMYEVLSRDAFLNALNDQALRIRVLDQQPKTLDDALSIVVRMESYSCDSRTDSADDVTERRRVRVVSPVRESETDKRIRKLEEHLERQNQELARLRVAANNVACSYQQGDGNSVDGNYVDYGGSCGTPLYGGTQENRGGFSQTPPPVSKRVARQGAGVQGSWQPTGCYSSDTPSRAAVTPDIPQQYSAGQQQQRAMFGGAPRGRGRGRGNRPNRLPRDVCSRCLQRGHWRAQCPAMGYQLWGGGSGHYGSSEIPPAAASGGSYYDPPCNTAYAYDGNNDCTPRTDPREQGRGNVQLLSDNGRSETYVDIVIKGRSIPALLDSGCERSVCPYRLCRNIKVTPVKVELYAANSTPIDVVGTARLQFSVCGVKMFADVYVSESVDELILGYDFLEQNKCEWLFSEHRVVMNGLSVSLRSRPSKCTVRRIYVREPIVVPPDTSINIPVRMPLVNLSTPKGEWLTEPKEVRPGLLAARTLLSHDDRFAAIAFLNLSGTNQALCKGLGLGMATMCPGDAIRPFTKSDSTAETVVGDSEGGVVELPPPVDAINDALPDNLILPPPPEFADEQCELDEIDRLIVPPPPADVISDVSLNDLILTPPSEFADEQYGCDAIDDLIVPPPFEFTDDLHSHDDVTDSVETVIKCASIRLNAGLSNNNDDDFAHVQPVIDKLPESLTAEQREKAIALIKHNADVFGRHEFDVGCTDLLTARIITDPNHPPIAEALRRHARVHLDVIDETIEKMKEAKIVEDACSPWSANLVVVGRKDDQGRPTTPRVTIDFRGLNSITYRDRYPIPHLGDCLRSLDKASYMSTIDLSNSFYQLPIHPDDRDKTAFLTRKGQFRLTRLGQGCTNSPAVFCRLMAMVLRGLTCCLAYVDDTICFSPSFESHLVDLESVFDRFRRANLKLKATKCRLFQTRCKFVGHFVSENGIEVDSAKVVCCQLAVSENCHGNA